MSEVTYYCLNCNRSEIQVPLVSLRYTAKPFWICPGCLPILIHHPERLAGKLEGVERLSPVPPDEE